MKTGFELAKARGSMEENGIDCLVANSQENVYYTSWAPITTITDLKRLAAILLPREGEPLFAVHANEQITARENTWIKDIRAYEGGEWEPLSPIGFVAEALREKGLEDGRIGLELLDMPSPWFDLLRGLLPSAEFVDAKPVFDRLRAVKSAEELRLLGEANMATAKAITVAFEMARPGDTEREVARNIADLALAYGADKVAFSYLGAGRNVFEIHHVPGDYGLRRGDLVHTDFGCLFQGYYSDISRMAVVGVPGEKQLEGHRFAVEAELAAAEAMRAGNRVMDVHNAAREFYESRGHRYTRAFIGHGMGIGCHEYPFLGPSHGDWVLEPGMFFQVETSLVTADMRIHTEDSFTVRAEGPAENVSEYRNIMELQVIR